MGVIHVNGEPGKKMLAQIELKKGEQEILEMLRSREWKVVSRGLTRFGAVEVPAELTNQVDAFMRRMVSVGVFGTKLGKFVPPPKGAKTDYYEIALNDARALGILLEK